MRIVMLGFVRTGVTISILAGWSPAVHPSVSAHGALQRSVRTLFGVSEPGPPLSLRLNFAGIDDERGPDLAIAAGITTVVLMRNQEIAIKGKTGALVASMNLNLFFNSVRRSDEGLTDPNIIYDRGTDRFFAVTSARAGINPSCTPGVCVSHYLLAVSRTPTPTDLGLSNWHFFSLDRTLDNAVLTTNWGDFDHINTTNDALVITSSVYSLQDRSAQGVKVRMIDKFRLIRGESITTWIDIRDDGLGRSDARGRRIGNRLLPATNMFPSSVFYLVATTSSCSFVIWEVTNPLSAPALSSATVDDRGTCPSPPDAVQPGGGQPLDVTGVGFNAQPVYQNGSVWVANTISRNFGSGSVAAIYVAEIDVSHWPDSVRTLQSWTIGEDQVWQFAPAIMVDSSSNVGIVYARSSSTEFASTYYSGRLGTDPPNTFRAGRPLTLRSGASVFSRLENGRNRFTDYFGSALDPVDNSIWMLGMYAKASNTSGSWVGNMRLAGP